MNSGEFRIPNLFIVGAPKCGTTSLAYWLGQHPDIFAPQEKEPGYFGSDLHGGSRQPAPSAYGEHYRDWHTQAFALDATPSYLVSSRAAMEIAAARCDAHIIVLVRNPAEAVHSAFHHARFRLTETLETIEEALDAEAGRKASGIAPRFGLLHSLLYTDIFHYRTNIARYLAVFPPKQVHVLLTEDMKARPKALMNDLFAALGLDQAVTEKIDLASRNEAGGGFWPFLTRMALHPPGWIGSISKRLLSVEQRGAARAKIRALNTRKAANPPLAPETRARLQAIFAEDIAWLEDYLQRDLRHWTAS